MRSSFLYWPVRSLTGVRSIDKLTSINFAYQPTCATFLFTCNCGDIHKLNGRFGHATRRPSGELGQNIVAYKERVYQAVVCLIWFYGCETWPVRVANERMLEAFDNDSIRRILRVRRRDCVPSVELRRRHCSCKAGSAGLVVLQGVPKVSWSRTFPFPHRLARGAGELEASRRRGQSLSRKTWSPSPDHDGERNGWKSLVSSHRTVYPRCEFHWWCHHSEQWANIKSPSNLV